MNFAKVFQIDSLHQVLLEIVKIPGYPPNTCIKFSSAINGDTISYILCYDDEDYMNFVFDHIEQDDVQSIYIDLLARYEAFKYGLGE